MSTDRHFILVDWGTSNFRAYLMDGNTVMERRASDRGAATLTKEQFPGYLKSQVHTWLSKLSQPIYLIGMAGSQIGWLEVPYVECPAGFSDLTNNVVSTAMEDTQVFFIPGIKGKNWWGYPDVMRGEESQIIGWNLQYGARASPDMFCLPGTHTKWAQLSNERLQCFATCMTGDIYKALSQHTILKATDQKTSLVAFREGLQNSRQHRVHLHQLFTARSRVVLGELEAEHAHSYLSGLLIGAEVAQLIDSDEIALSKGNVAIIGNSELCELYRLALNYWSIEAQIYDPEPCIVAFGNQLHEIIE